jgi:hypothetical protein
VALYNSFAPCIKNLLVILAEVICQKASRK